MSKYRQAHYADFLPTDNQITSLLLDIRAEDSWRFLQSVQDQLHRRGTLSPRQVEVVEEIWHRVH